MGRHKINGEYEARDQRMAMYASLINLRLGSFAAWLLEHILRSSNRKVDTLAAVVASLPIKETMIHPVYYQSELSITTNQINEVEEATPSRMTPTVCYLSSREFLDDKAEAHKIQV